MAGLTDPIAIVGSTPFSALLAGLLAADHSRTVFLSAPELGSIHLTRTLSSFHAPVTRPQTWEILIETRRDAIQWIDRMAPSSLRPCDTLMLASRPEALAALEHIRHVVAGFRLAVDHVANPAYADDLAYRFENGWQIDAHAFGIGARDWLGTAGVTLADGTVEIAADGSGRIGDHDVGTVILADDAAILAHLPPEQIAPMADVETVTGLLCAPGQTEIDGIVFDLDTGVVASPRLDGTLEILAPGEERMARAYGAALPGGRAMRLAGRRRIERLCPRDGAPVIGIMGARGPIVLFGLGALDMALAPAIARFLCDADSEIEHEWCAARAPDRTFAASTVAEFVAPTLAGQAA